MIVASARPRYWSGAPRWTRRRLQTIAAPFPAAPPMTNTTASQIDPLSAAAPQPTPISTIEPT
jgi:hypothetical protein